MKILVLSDSPTIPTGYRNQMFQLVKHLNEKHEIHWLANGYLGKNMKKVIFDDDSEIEVNIYGHAPNDQYFSKSMQHYLKTIRPDRFIILLDTFMLFQTGFLNQDTSPARTYFWYPSDGGGGMPKNCEKILQKIDVPVAMARFGQKQVKDYYNIQAEHIPHGLDVKKFYRLPDEQRNEQRAKYGLTDKFVIGVVARNQPRKNLDRTIKAMRLISDKIPNSVLFLHLDPDDPAQYCDLKEVIRTYNLENRVVFSGMKAHSGFPDSEMINIYNLMDVFLLTTSGEGFGIPIIEAMACQVPVVATDYTTTPELVIQNNCGLGIKLSGTEELDMFQTDMKKYDLLKLNGTILGSWFVERGFCSITDCAEKVKFLYENPELCKQMGQNGKKAVMAKYDFELVGKQWEELLK